jgi:hypothetical protein
VILDEYGDVMELVGPPRWLQRLAIPLLARLGRARGLRASYRHHDEVYARWQQQARTAEPVGSPTWRHHRSSSARLVSAIQASILSSDHP